MGTRGMPLAANTPGDDCGELVDFSVARERRRSHTRGPYGDAESCAAMMIACIAASAGAPTEIVEASSPFMEHLVGGLVAASAGTAFDVAVTLGDGTAITVEFDGASMSVAVSGGDTAAGRLAGAAIRAVIDQWTLDHLVRPADDEARDVDRGR